MSDVILKDNLYNIIDIRLKNKALTNKFNAYVSAYIDKNNDVLYASTPLYRLFFSDEENRKFVFDLVGVHKESIKELIKKVDVIKSSWKVLSDPFNILMTNIIRFATIKKDEVLLKNSLLYLTLSLYSSLHFKYYKYLPNENCMQYTINNVSNKFLFKKYGVILKALYHTSLASHEKYASILMRGNDLDMKDYLMNLRTRLNNLLQHFTNEYMKNLKNKKYLNTDTDVDTEDKYYENNNISLEIDKLTVKTITTFYRSSLISKFIRLSAKYSNCSPVTLGRALQSIKKNEKEKVEQIIRLILTLYLSNGQNSLESLKSQRFIVYNIAMYGKSNSKDKDLLNIKKILNYFLENNCNKYSETEREATRVSYRKALFLYFVFFIQFCSLG